MAARKTRSSARAHVRLAKRGARAQSEQAGERPGWTFLSNHAHVLLLIAKESQIRLRDVAVRVGITERAVQRIVTDLEAGNYIERERVGRRNRYKVHRELPLRHPIEAHRKISSLISLVVDA